MKKLLLTFIMAVSGFLAGAQKLLVEKTNPVFISVGMAAEEKHYSGIEITWINPSDYLTTTNQNRLNLKLGITSTKGLKKFQILVNGEDIVYSRGLGVRKEKEPGYEQFSQLISQDIYLKSGDNQIIIKVVNDEEEMREDERLVKFEEITIETLKRTDYALIFATNDYESWDDLTNPVFDATTIANELEENYGFNVELVLNATNTQILLKIKEYAQKSYLEYDQLFIFFAGHGQYDELYGEGYLVAKNSQRDDAAKTSYISHSVLRNAVDNIPSDHIFLALDACFGGTFDPKISKSTNRGFLDPVYRELNLAEFIKRKLKYKTRLYLTSGGKEYVPDGRPGMHSPFARKFIEALRSYGGDDKVLTLGELNAVVEKIDPEPRSGEFGKNEPGSDFLFIAK